MTTTFVQITPFMHVPNLERALTFFTDVLGFETLVRMDDYAYVHRETVGIRIMQNQGDDGAPPGNRRCRAPLITAAWPHWFSTGSYRLASDGSRRNDVSPRLKPTVMQLKR